MILTNQTDQGYRIRPAATCKLIGFYQRNLKRRAAGDGQPVRAVRSARYDYDFPTRAAKGEWQGDAEQAPAGQFPRRAAVVRRATASRRKAPTCRATRAGSTARPASVTGPPDRRLASAHRAGRRPAASAIFPESFLGGNHTLQDGLPDLLRVGRHGVAATWRRGNYQLIYDRVGGVPNRPVEIEAYNNPITVAGQQGDAVLGVPPGQAGRSAAV